MPEHIIGAIIEAAAELLSGGVVEGVVELTKRGDTPTGATPAKSALAAIFQGRLLDEYRAPKNRRELTNPTSVAERKNPVCGDALRIMVRVVDGTVVDVAFLGHGCSIAMASASLMTQAMVAQTSAQAKSTVETLHAMLRGAAAEALPTLVDPLRAVAPFPARHGCVMLPWLALRDALG